MQGILKPKMLNVASNIREHSTLIYAIQTRKPWLLQPSMWKKVVLTNQLLNLLEEARVVSFSIRLEKRAIQLASAMSLLNYFNCRSDVIPIDDTTCKITLQFFVEEAWIRSKKHFHCLKFSRS